MANPIDEWLARVGGFAGLPGEATETRGSRAPLDAINALIRDTGAYRSLSPFAVNALRRRAGDIGTAQNLLEAGQGKSPDSVDWRLMSGGSLAQIIPQLLKGSLGSWAAPLLSNLRNTLAASSGSGEGVAGYWERSPQMLAAAASLGMSGPFGEYLKDKLEEELGIEASRGAEAQRPALNWLDMILANRGVAAQPSGAFYPRGVPRNLPPGV